MEIEGAIDIGEIFYILSTRNLDNIACGGVNRIKGTVNREGIIIVGIAEIEAVSYPGKLVKVSGIIVSSATFVFFVAFAFLAGTVLFLFFVVAFVVEAAC